MGYDDWAPEKKIEFWKMQATMMHQENEQLSAGIKRIYGLVGLRKKFEVAHNPAHNQLEAIIAKLEKEK